MDYIVRKRKGIGKAYLILLLAMMALLVACSNDDGDATDEKVAEQEVENEEEGLEENNEAEEVGLTLENDGIDEADLNEALEEFPEEIPERLITTSVPLAEMLSLLDITPVGVPTSTNPLPEDFKDIDQIGSPMAPDLEVITELSPDLVLGAESLRSSLEESLGGMDLPTAYLRTDSFDDLKLAFKALGTYYGKTEEMNEKLQSILDKENELVQLMEDETLPSVMLMIGTSDSFMVMSDQSYLGSLVDRLGAENIATTLLNVESTYSTMNMEDIVVADPDLILVLASGDHGATEEMFEKEVENNDLWKTLSAYENDNIHILDYEVFGVTSILNVETALSEVVNFFIE
ncbi:ABC transporter substrate-binding protein [Ornithinibacillus sp. 4-3]|uniref:ABC transporter substrate-binding protein n=1 Tax=Ornithinibacillus sp. 4-3 TaxID=3231488 RepID=A0AB39HHN3_9BACI